MKEKDNGMIDVEVSREAAEATERIRRHIESLPEEKRPKVCIKCITYNHGEFIREALDGFLMQQTDFPFVAIVHDDASTDNTADIVREYAERYPDIIFPIFETENQYRKPGGPLTKIMQDAIDATGARYVACCEGDDYWTNSLKLQKQVSFLESHPDYVMCSHSCTYLYQETGRLWHEDLGESREYGLDNLAIKGEWLFQPLTIVYRCEPKSMEAYMRYSHKRDAALIYSILKNGKGYLMKESMACYRVHSGGVWSKANESQRWDSEYSVRKGIYEVEKTDIAATYLENCLKIKTIGRAALIKRLKEVANVLYVVSKHKGFVPATRLMLNAFIKR